MTDIPRKAAEMDQFDLHERLSHLSIQPNPALVEHAERRAESVQNRVAHKITAFAGSMRFVYLHILWFGLWIELSAETEWRRRLAPPELLTDRPREVLFYPNKIVSGFASPAGAPVYGDETTRPPPTFWNAVRLY